MPDVKPVPAITIASAKPLSELSPEERRARWRELSKKMRKDQSEVRGESGQHYFWACNQGQGSGSELIRLETIGYTLVREPNVAEVLAGKAKPKIQAAGLREDGTYVRGDVILMQCPQEDYEFFLLDIEKRQEEAAEGIPNEFISNAEQQGAPTFTVNKK